MIGVRLLTCTQNFLNEYVILEKINLSTFLGKALHWDVKNCQGGFYGQGHPKPKRGFYDDQYNALLERDISVPKRGGCITIDFHLGANDVCELQATLISNSHHGDHRIYYRKARSRGGKLQKAFITIPPSRGGCSRKTVCLIIRFYKNWGGGEAWTVFVTCIHI